MLLPEFVVLPLMFVLVGTGNFWLAVLGMGLATFPHAMYHAALAGILARVFPVEVRYTGMSLSYQLCTTLSPGTAPIVSQYLAHRLRLDLAGRGAWPGLHRDHPGGCAAAAGPHGRERARPHRAPCGDRAAGSGAAPRDGTPPTSHLGSPLELRRPRPRPAPPPRPRPVRGGPHPRRTPPRRARRARRGRPRPAGRPADANPPRLVQYAADGTRVDEIAFHPAHDRAAAIAYERFDSPRCRTGPASSAGPRRSRTPSSTPSPTCTCRPSSAWLRPLSMTDSAARILRLFDPRAGTPTR
ncbi:hypothetical protein [Streptomyces sp. KL116D]|uniref:hypothetical protein n=1 Tax=Streptomyces sp. KL116D TaxID=3045152 RepID=UPI003557DABA